jgi:hypothetical protein
MRGAARGLRRLVFAGVVLAGFFGVMLGVEMVAVRKMRVMASFFVLCGAVMLGGLAMMLGGGLVVFGGLLVMLCQKGGVHGRSPVDGRLARAGFATAG